MKKLQEFIKKFGTIIIILMSTSIVFGVLSYINIPKQSFPTIELPLMQLELVAPGLSAEEVNDKIVIPVEDAVRKLDDVDNVISYSFANGGSVISVFELDTDVSIEDQYQKLSHLVDEISFPENVSVNFSYDFKESHAILAITGENQLEIAQDLTDKLMTIEEIDNIITTPEYSESLYIHADLNILSAIGLSYTQFIEILSAKGIQIPLGYVNDGSNAPIVSTNNFATIEELQNLVLFINPQTQQPVLLSNVATVEEQSTVNSFYEFDGEKTSLLEIYFKSDQDYTKVGDVIDEIIEDSEFSSNINKVSFQPTNVKEEVNNIFTNLLQSIALVFIVVLIGLGFRNSVVISFAFPFVLMSTLCILYLLGMQLQKISIAGLIISIGVIVDNAIVMCESIQHYINLDYKKSEAVNLSLKNNFTPLFTSTLTTIAAFIPLLFLPGIAGKVAVSLPTTVIISIALSFIFSVFILPVLSLKILKKPKKVKLHHDNITVGKIFKKIYSKPKTVLSLAILSSILLFSLALSLVVQVFPTADQDVVYIEYTNTTSSTLEDTKALEVDMINFMVSLDYINVDSIEGTTSVIGGKMPQYYSTLPTMPLNSNQGYIYLDTDGENTSDIKKSLQEDLTNEFSSRAIINTNEIELNSPLAPVQVSVSGNDYDEIINYVESVIPSIEAIDGARKVDYNFPQTTNMYEINYNEDFLNANNIQPIQVEQQIALLLNDYSIDIIDSDKYESSAFITSGVKTVDQLVNQQFVINAQPYTSSQLFSLDVSNAYEFFSRNDYSLAVNISVYNNEDASPYALEDEIKEVLEDSLPSSLSLVYESERTLANDVFGNIGIAAFIAFILIILILMFEFKSLKSILSIGISIILSLSGSILILFILDMPFTFSVGLGLTSLLGIVVNNGILLISYIDKYKYEFDNLLDACVAGLNRRLKPILISNITTMTGLVPLMITQSSFFQPMALALFGGLLLGILFTILVTPTSYYLLNRKS